MCQCHPAAACSGCAPGFHRRGFLKTCGAAVAAGSLAPLAVLATEGTGGPKPRVALVFLSNSQGREIWPYPDYDCPKRHDEILNALHEGCPQVEFVPVVVAHAGEIQKALDLKDAVDGYLIYTLTLQWEFTAPLVQLGKLGKPTLVADEYLGGSGVFLTGFAALRRQVASAAAVSSTRLEDLVAVARVFADVNKPGVTPEVFAQRCEAVARQTYGAGAASPCAEDRLALTEIGECLRRLNESRFLIVGAGPAGQERNFLGAKGIYVGFEELQALYEQADRDQAAEYAGRWTKQAERVVEPTTEWLQKAGAVYLALRAVMKKYGTDSVTANCLGGFASGQLPAYPCLGFMQILDEGGQGVCEAMPDDSVSMLMARILTGRPGYVSDPALDTSKNQIVYSHCMAMTKVFGPDREPCRFRIRTLHNRDPRGCCAQSFLPEGYITTTFRTSIGRKQLVIHRAKSVGNLDSEFGCRTQLLGEVCGDIGKLFREWDHFGWHRVTVYGDVQEPLSEFGRALGLEVIQEA